ncbi:hypothetical protein, partial [Komagataeibacter xylinus]|uniref:hypothetical protein n=1 Tax=Komagataeibacter xylinus TaxID=28448 RepID=UPI001C3F2CD8
PVFAKSTLGYCLSRAVMHCLSETFVPQKANPGCRSDLNRWTGSITQARLTPELYYVVKEGKILYPLWLAKHDLPS